jgi:hypothetical protein
VEDSDGLRAILEDIGEPEVCFKLVKGWTGRGFYRAHLEGDRLRFEPEGETVTVSDFWRDTVARNGSYMVQRVITQHTDTAAFHPASVNTTRVWMAQETPGGWSPFSAVFRMGVGGSVVDNRPGWSIVSRVNVETGSLGPAVKDSVDRPTFAAHPTTGVPIENAVLPMWQQAMQSCYAACDLVPFLKLVGFDVAFAEHGPLVLELESMPGDDQVGFDRGVKSLFRRLSRRGPVS